MHNLQSGVLEEHWYPVPIWYTSLSDIPNEDRILAIDFCKKKQSENDGRVRSNKGGWQSNDLYAKDLIETPLHIYLERVRPVLDHCKKSLGIVKDLDFNNIWININSKNSYNEVHSHPGIVLSGVFYLTEKNSSIVFNRPTGVHGYFLRNYTNGQTPLSFYNVFYRDLKPHDLLIFPGWLEHSVEPNNNDEERISIAFNTYLYD